MKRGDLVVFRHHVPPKYEEGEKDLYGIIVNNSVTTCHNGKEFRDVRWFGRPRVRPIRIDYLEVVSESR